MSSRMRCWATQRHRGAEQCSEAKQQQMLVFMTLHGMVPYAGSALHRPRLICR